MGVCLLCVKACSPVAIRDGTIVIVFEQVHQATESVSWGESGLHADHFVEIGAGTVDLAFLEVAGTTTEEADKTIFGRAAFGEARAGSQ